MPKATAVFDADDSRLGAALTRINQRMLALQERVAKFAGAWVAVQSVSHLVAAGFSRLTQLLWTRSGPTADDSLRNGSPLVRDGRTAGLCSRAG